MSFILPLVNKMYHKVQNAYTLGIQPPRYSSQKTLWSSAGKHLMSTKYLSSYTPEPSGRYDGEAQCSNSDMTCGIGLLTIRNIFGFCTMMLHSTMTSSNVHQLGLKKNK